MAYKFSYLTCFWAYFSGLPFVDFTFTLFTKLFLDILEVSCSTVIKSAQIRSWRYTNAHGRVFWPKYSITVIEKSELFSNVFEI